MKPRDALQLAVDRAFFIPRYKGKNSKPGQVIQEMSEEARLALQDLTSDDAANVRIK